MQTLYPCGFYGDTVRVPPLAGVIQHYLGRILRAAAGAIRYLYPSGRREVADPWPTSQDKPPIGRLAFQIKERMNLILTFPFPRVGSQGQLGGISSKRVQTGEATPEEESHSANTSCSASTWR